MNRLRDRANAAARDEFHRTVLDAIPDPIFVVDDDVRIVHCNRAAAALAEVSPELVQRRRGGDVLRCIHALSVPGGCGTAPACGRCGIRNSVRHAFAGQQPHRIRDKVVMVRGDQTVEVHVLVTTAPVEYVGEHLALLVLEDINELVALRRILPICAHCHKVRDDKQYWQDVEAYCRRQLDIDFSHGICPKCLKRHYPEFAGEVG